MSFLLKNKTLLLLIASLIGIALFCDIASILEKPPSSIHIWRQTDCLSLTKNYSENLNFLEPAIHNYISEDRSSGKTVGEFPIIYYTVGAVWKYFGESIYFYRLFGLIIFSIAIVYLFKAVYLLTTSNFWSYFAAILLYTSPVLFFYSLNFLTNVYALSFVLISWYCMIRFLKYKRYKSLLFFTAFALLAGLLKVTALISVFALMGGLVLDALIKRKIPQSHLSVLWSVLSICAVIVAWFYWAELYNGKYGGKYTFNSIWPIWEMSKEEIDNAVTFGKEFIYKQMFNPLTWTIIWLPFVLLCLNLKKNLVLTLSLIILFLGSLTYCILWFSAFDAHDYYISNLMIFPIAVLVTGLYIAKKDFPKLLASKSLKWGASILLIYNIIYLGTNMHRRYSDKLWNDDVTSGFFINSYEESIWTGMDWVSRHYEGLWDMREYNRSIGIEADDLIIYISDPTFNASLYLLNQKGWTSFPGNYTDTEVGIQQKIDKNAKYLILGLLANKNEPFLQKFLHTKVGEFKGREIYQLQ